MQFQVVPHQSVWWSNFILDQWCFPKPNVVHCLSCNVLDPTFPDIWTLMYKQAPWWPPSDQNTDWTWHAYKWQFYSFWDLPMQVLISAACPKGLFCLQMFYWLIFTLCFFHLTKDVRRACGAEFLQEQPEGRAVEGATGLPPTTPVTRVTTKTTTAAAVVSRNLLFFAGDLFLMICHEKSGFLNM